MRLTEREMAVLIAALEQLPTPVRRNWGWWTGEPRQSLDQYEVLEILRSGCHAEGLALHPAVSLAIARVYGKLDRLTVWHIYRADTDLCRSIPDFRCRLDADPQALAEELRRAL